MRALLIGWIGCGAALLAGCTGLHRSQSAALVVPEGSADVQYAQGVRLLVQEDGSPNDPQQAYAWLLAAARKGHSNAQAMVGLCLQKGLGVEADEHEAMEWYKKAARKGQGGAALMLARELDAKGRPDEARKWLETALRRGKGSADVHVMLASLYLRQGLNKQAVEHLRYAAMEGSPEAAYLMALCYEQGRGVAANEQLMRGWLSNAATMGYAPAKDRLKKKDEVRGTKDEVAAPEQE